MNLPTFTAERSLYSSAGAYAGGAVHGRGRRGALAPALSVTYCKSARPGWAIENSLCGECAEFRIRCIPRIGCFAQQVSPWRNECWATEFASE
jgi:hypothetical protein